MINKTWEEFQKVCNVLYEKKINERLVIQIGQLIDQDSLFVQRSQFLVLVLRDEYLDKWMSLKLSTVRRVWKFLIKKEFNEARRLKDFELRKLKKQEDSK